jgi:energy-coupling factor transporter ATP-binding protein EcfA2
MSYSFSNLAPADFEDLARDLIGQELGMRFEAFGPGPDGGMDGRHAKGRAATILQAKHYAGSTFGTLSSAMRRERSSIDHLKPKRYLLATSRSLTPPNKKSLGRAIGPALKAQSDIFSSDDLNGLLRKYPEIERAHIKLWLSSAAVLERVTHAAVYTYTAITMEEIANKVRVYAPNPSFKAARDTLESQRIVIISGPPGVGKTTLAEMLSYAYVGEDWELVPIRSLDDGFARIVDPKKQVFFFDDFLGKIALDKNALASKDSDLSRFMKRIRASPNARFILATRAYIFEEARRVSEYLADERLDISKYVLDVGVYTRRIRARILYNHLLVAGTPIGHIRNLVESGKIPKIVDHANYNPRIIEWMTDALHIGPIASEHYADEFLSALANPKKLWDTAFRTHIPEKCRHLLYALFFGSDFGEDIADLRLAYQSLHPHLSERYGQPHDPKDFEEALRILEGSFISIDNGSVSFVNPSVGDYLTDYLSDLDQLRDFAAVARQADWAQRLWRHGKKIAEKAELADFARAFRAIAGEFLRIPVWKRSSPNSLSAADISNTDRIELLVTWWEASGDKEFARLATELSERPVNGFDSWRDGTDLIEMILNIRNDYYDGFPYTGEILAALEEGAVAMLNSGVGSDDLERLSDSVSEAAETLPPDIVEAANQVIRREFEEIDWMVADANSESTLEEHKTMLKKLAPRARISSATLASAVRTIDERIAAISEETEEAHAPSFSGAGEKQADTFDNNALMNLFVPLLYR